MLPRDFEQHAPGLGLRDRLERFDYLQQFIVVQHLRLAGGDQAGELGALVGEGLVDRFAQQRGVAGVAGEEAAGADDADVAGAVVELLVGLEAEFLQAGEADVDPQHANHLAVQFQWEGDAGHQRRRVVDVVDVGIDQAGGAGVARAGVPAVVGHAVGARCGIGEQLLGHRLGVQLARGALRPVQGEAALVVTAQLALVDEQLVLAVQRVGFEHHVEAEQRRVGVQRGTYLAGQVLAQVVGIEEALFRLVAQEQHLAGKALAVLVGIHEVALDAQGLGFAACLHALHGGLLEHLRTGALHQLGAAARLIERRSYQQGDDRQQAEASQQADFPLDGETIGQHAEHLLFIGLLASIGRCADSLTPGGHSSRTFGGRHGQARSMLERRRRRLEVARCRLAERSRAWFDRGPGPGQSARFFAPDRAQEGEAHERGGGCDRHHVGAQPVPGARGDRLDRRCAGRRPARWAGPGGHAQGLQRWPGRRCHGGAVLRDAGGLRGGHRQVGAGACSGGQGPGACRAAARTGRRRGEGVADRADPGRGDLVAEHPADPHRLHSAADPATALRVRPPAHRPAADRLRHHLWPDHTLHVPASGLRQHLPQRDPAGQRQPRRGRRERGERHRGDGDSSARHALRPAVGGAGQLSRQA
ncbi:hypothetical protein D9M70_402850 [compost metagenome]